MQGDSELGRAVLVQEQAALVGFDWPDASGPVAKVREEIAELERETGGGSREAINEEIGDLLFAAVNVARKLAVDPETALARATDKFERRFAGVKRLAQTRGISLEGSSLEALDALWNEVKGG